MKISEVIIVTAAVSLGSTALAFSAPFDNTETNRITYESTNHLSKRHPQEVVSLCEGKSCLAGLPEFLRQQQQGTPAQPNSGQQPGTGVTNLQYHIDENGKKKTIDLTPPPEYKPTHETFTKKKVLDLTPPPPEYKPTQETFTKKKVLDLTPPPVFKPTDVTQVIQQNNNHVVVQQSNQCPSGNCQNAANNNGAATEQPTPENRGADDAKKAEGTTPNGAAKNKEDKKKKDKGERSGSSATAVLSSGLGAVIVMVVLSWF